MTGGIEPTDSDCDWPSDDETEEEKKLLVRPKTELKILNLFWSCIIEVFCMRLNEIVFDGYLNVARL